MLQIEQTPLWADIRDIINSGKKKTKHELKGMFHTEKEDVPILKITSIDTVRDYAKNVGDHVQLEFRLPLGEYVYRLYPFRTNLEVTIKKIILEETGSSAQKNSKIVTERYKAIFIPGQNPSVNGGDLELHDIEALNKRDIVNVKLQLLDRSLETLRIKTISGAFKQVTPKQLLHNVIAGESAKILVDGKTAVDGIDIVEPNNLDVKQHIIIPQGTNITSIATYLQEKQGGLYSGGVGNYLQRYNGKKLWFVYPLFDVGRFKNPVGKAIIYAIPKERLQGADRTFKKDGSILHVLATSDKKYQDSADTDSMNFGNGFRMADARSYMKKPIEITKDGPKAKRVGLNHEVAVSARSDGLNYAPVSSSGASSNPYKEYAKVLARNVARTDFIWESADPDLIYPGMPCQYIFLHKNKPVKLEGVVLFVHALTQLQGSGINDGVYKTQCQITIVTEKHTTTPDIPKTQAHGDY